MDHQGHDLDQQGGHNPDQRADQVRLDDMEHASGGSPGDSMFGLLSNVERQLANLREAHASINDRKEKLKARESQVLAAAEQVKSKDAELKERQQKLGERLDEMQARLETAEQAASESARLSASLDEARAALEEANARAQEAESRIAQLEHASQEQDAARAGELNEANARIGALEEELAKFSDVAARADASDERAAQLEEELAQKSESLARAEQAAQRVPQLEQELSQQSDAAAGAAQASERVAQLEQELEQVTARLNDAVAASSQEGDRASEALAELETLRTAKTEHESRIASLQGEVESKSATVKRLEEEIERIREGDTQDAARLAGAVTERDRRINELKSKVEELTAREAELSAAVNAREASLSAKERELSDANDRIESLECQIETPSAPARVRKKFPDEWLSNRRDRLARYRQLLRRETNKLRRASDVLAERLDEVDRLLKQRGELVAIRQALGEAQQKLNRDRASSRTVVTMTAAAIMLACLVTFSWLAAQQVAPGLYSVTTVLEAEPGDRTPTAGQLVEWRRYHEELFKDPQLIELVAERMARRGIESLSTAGAVRKRFNTDIVTSSTEPGKLQIELRGRGSTNTLREMETIVTALASKANKSRATRSDSMATRVGQEPTAGAQPIDQAQLIWAAGLFAGSTLITASIGVFWWRRLVHQKARLENESAIDDMLADSRWMDSGVGREDQRYAA